MQYHSFLRLAVVALVPLFACAAQAQRTIPGLKLNTPPKIDGVVDLKEWDNIPTVTGGFDEQTGAPCPDSQQFWIAYDERFIYFAARLGDKEPSKIHATETRMNVSLKADDHVILAVDPFGNLQNLNQFRINANGAAHLQIAGGRAPKREWVGEILSAGRITADGWECEARIPWAIMQLPPAGKRTLRADFARAVFRTGRGYIASNIAGEQVQNISKWGDVEVPKASSRRTLKLLPYGYAGYSESDKETLSQGGLDLKTSLTEGLEFVGTVRPDFRNIENDVLSLDFSYFERLAGESRPFFQEGQEFFSTSMDAPLFASQRIRKFDTGMKVYGKLNDRLRVAFLDTAEFGEFNGAVANLDYQIGPRENFRVAGTHLDQNGRNNSANFLAYNRAFGYASFFGQISTTDDDEVGGGHRYNTGFSYQKDGIDGFAEYQEISNDYTPGLGFAPKRNFRGYNTFVNWTKTHRHDQIMETGLALGASHEDDFDGNPFRRSFYGSTSLTLRDNTDLDVTGSYEEIQGFKDHLWSISLERPRGDAYRRWDLTYAWGNVAGKPLFLFGPTMNYRPLKNFQVTLRHQELDHGDRSRLTILGLNYELNRFESVSGRVLRRNDDTNWYLAWRRAGNRGAEYYVILGDPNAKTFQTSLILKVVLPIELVLGK